MLLSCWPLSPRCVQEGRCLLKRGAQYTMQKKNGPSPSKDSTGLRDASVLLPPGGRSTSGKMYIAIKYTFTQRTWEWKNLN